MPLIFGKLATAKPDQYQDPHGLALFLAPWIRIRIEVKSCIRIRIETNANLNHCRVRFRIFLQLLSVLGF
jgi:hypothetical protein